MYTMSNFKVCLVLVSFLLVSSSVFSAEHTVAQKNKMFTTSKLEIRVGDVIHFKNGDPFFHNVFSLSDTQFFDLGSYPKDESKSVEFENAGDVEVECAIHPEMKMTVVVK